MVMSTLLASDLSPALVTRQQFAFTRWYRASGPWYYQRSGFCAAAALDEDAYAQIDPALRQLCQLMHAHGLSTTPSCQGHFYPTRYFRSAWRTLLDEAKRIRTDGLLVQDAQSGETYCFADAHYALPWPSGDAFCQEAHRQQQAGYLGVVVPSAPDDRGDWLLSAGNTSPNAVRLARRAVDEQRDLIDMHVHAGDPHEQARAWAALTDAVAACLRR